MAFGAPDAKPIWASGRCAASTGRTHDRYRTYRQISISAPLAPKGPFSNRALLVNELDASGGARPGSRFSSRSNEFAATSGSKHRRCNVHNELTCFACGSRPSLAASLHPRPGGQPSHPAFSPDVVQ
jgi:hypothetical protein